MHTSMESEYLKNLVQFMIFVGVQAYSYAYYGQGYGGIFLDNVACSGTESMLTDCISSSHIGVHNCQHYADAGVKCGGKENNKIIAVF